MPRKPRTFVTHPSNPISTWSPSKESTFKACPSHAAFDVTNKVPQDDGPALVHGRKVHDEIAEAIRGQNRAVGRWQEAAPYAALIAKELQPALLSHANAAAELEIALRRDLSLTEWMAKDVWYRAKLDLVFKRGADTLVVLDWKTGKPNEKDKAQLTQYAWVGALLARVARVETRLVYLAVGTVDTASFTIDEVRRLGEGWRLRGEEITNPKLRIVATPSESACRFCPHGKSRGGPCAFDIRNQTAAGLRHAWGGGSL